MLAKKALIPYIAAGDPSAAMTVELMHALVRGGADLIELGVPFSDPMADGPRDPASGRTGDQKTAWDWRRFSPWCKSSAVSIQTPRSF